MAAPELQFELDGHDCPLGEYPSVVVPVGRRAGDLVAVYTSGGSPSFHSVASDARFTRHSPTTASALSGFDPFRHALFALSEANVVSFALGEQREFYSRLLASSASFTIEPFYKLSLAVETEKPSLIRSVYKICARRLERDAPDLRDAWAKAAGSMSPLIEAAQGLLRDAERPWLIVDSRAGSISAANLLEGETLPEELPLPERPDDVEVFLARGGRAVEPDLIGRALKELAGAAFISGTWMGAYADAIRASLGFVASPEGVRLADVPSPDDVARYSGLSVPHLELQNIVLNRSTAAEFLRFASRRVVPGDVLRRAFGNERYRRMFGRKMVKVKQRPVFTYAEVLQLAGYLGPFMAELWLNG